MAGDIDESDAQIAELQVHKPRSIVIPRFFLPATGRIGSRERANALLPWSMWPAVPDNGERWHRL